MLEDNENNLQQNQSNSFFFCFFVLKKKKLVIKKNILNLHKYIKNLLQEPNNKIWIGESDNQLYKLYFIESKYMDVELMNKFLNYEIFIFFFKFFIEFLKIKKKKENFYGFLL